MSKSEQKRIEIQEERHKKKYVDDTCPVCHGSGVLDYTVPYGKYYGENEEQICFHCNGRGYVK